MNNTFAYLFVIHLYWCTSTTATREQYQHSGNDIPITGLKTITQHEAPQSCFTMPPCQGITYPRDRNRL